MAIQQFHGEGARTRLGLLASRAFEDDATGGVYGYLRLPGGANPILNRIHEPEEALSTDYEMVIVDSGNGSGDAWKYIYHVQSQCGTEIDEGV